MSAARRDCWKGSASGGDVGRQMFIVFQGADRESRLGRSGGGRQVYHTGSCWQGKAQVRCQGARV